MRLSGTLLTVWLGIMHLGMLLYIKQQSHYSVATGSMILVATSCYEKHSITQIQQLIHYVTCLTCMKILHLQHPKMTHA